MKNEPRRVIALDVGDVRIGVALSDPLNHYAMPHCTIERKGRAIFKELQEIALNNNVGTIVVGLPAELDGTIGAQAKKVQAFAKQLEKALSREPQLNGLSIVMCDERLTTAEAERVIAGSKLKNAERSALLDRIAAALILESFLNSQHE